MKAYWIPAFLAPALLAGESLSTDYARERALRVEAETVLELETTAFEVERDGVPVDRPGRGGGRAVEEVRRLVAVDRVLAHDGGRPTRVRRAYEELEARTHSTSGERESESEREGELTGATLEVSLEEDGSLRVEVVEGNEPESSAALDGQRLELVLDALLLTDEVETDQTWSLEGGAIRRALGLDLEPALFPRPERPEDAGEGRGGGRRRRFGGMGGGVPLAQLGGAEWEGTATLSAEREEHEGLACAVVVLALEARGDLSRDDEGVSSEGSVEVELEGRLFVSLEERRPVLLELEGPVAIESTVELSRGEGTTTIRTTQAGTLTHRVVVGAE